MLALVPLDNRPCNVRFPQQIAAIGRSQLVTPPVNILGCFEVPGRPELISDWLSGLPEIEGVIVSIDMLAYGGLVASRHASLAEEEALARLQALRDFRRAHPATPIYAFNILMRLAVTLSSDASVANYYNIMRYARLADEAGRFESDYLREQLQNVIAEIPPQVLQDYRAARARNHAVNCRMIDWLAEGVFDYLLITQEDATEFGLHRREQDALLARARELNAATKMSLHPGADEASLTLLARHWDTGVRFALHWSCREDARRIAPFEDRIFDHALVQHIAAMRGVIVEKDADFELFINAPVGGSQKDETPAQQTARSARINPFVRELVAAVESGQRVALCDVAFPNGADNLLMSELEQRGVLGKLAVYGGWNTAGNTTGTVLAQCAALRHSGDWDNIHSPANRQFVFERLMDDWFYQARIRAHLEKSARAQQLSPLNMGEGYTPIEAQARRELHGYARLLAQRQFGTTLRDWAVSLPWRRTFEVDLHADLT
ncbi:MAG TPA: DUF4127 family protein [Abditibacteriaceae bacterium]|nr:DUF4127 family protein [Abditibacteriaceae bacterium]